MYCAKRRSNDGRIYFVVEKPFSVFNSPQVSLTIENPLPPIKACGYPCWASLSSSRAGRHLWTRKKSTDPSGLFKRLINPHRGFRGGRGFRALCEPPLSWSLNLPKYQAPSSMIQSSSLFSPLVPEDRSEDRENRTSEIGFWYCRNFSSRRFSSDKPDAALPLAT